MTASAVVFAYHDVGVRCLRVLLAHGVHVPLVLTHADAPGETIWFDSVRRHAEWHGIPVIEPEDPNTAEVVARVAATKPDFLFSFYYRRMLKEQLLQLPVHGAYNMHGSVLPQYRGRVPVNWAVLKGERYTGATLHRMTLKPDAGELLGQQAVPILPDDTAVEVFRKVTVAAELVLDGVLPQLLSHSAKPWAQDLKAGSYYGGRSARDGVIDWRQGALAVHNLVRAVAPPYPGATTAADGHAVRILRTLPVTLPSPAGGPAAGPDGAAVMRWHDGAVYCQCAGGALKLLEFELSPAGVNAHAAPVRDAAGFYRLFGERPLALKPFME